MENQSKIEAFVTSYLLRNIGQTCTVQSVEFNEEKKRWDVIFKGIYPRELHNDEENKVFYRFLKFKNIGSAKVMQVDNYFKIETEMTSNNLDSILRKKINSWTKNIECLLVRASSEYLADIEDLHFFLNPIGEIITMIRGKGKITIKDIEDHTTPERFKKYLFLLNELGLIEQEENSFKYGEVFVGFEEKVQNEMKSFADLEQNELLKRLVYGFVIRERFSYLTEVMKISMLSHFIKISNSYYAPTIEAEQLLYMRHESIHRNFLDLYGKKPEVKFRSSLQKITNAGLINKSNNLYYGKKDVFEKMMTNQNKMCRAIGH